ncbi:MAG: M20/M25/M40 family metallo-hydrolase [Acidobacteriota bacterium]|nr:M20/M25/M40 family metallo-hydrolase [Acidobacteriota bacterium]
MDDSRLHDALAAARPIELAAELVRIPSHPGLARQEEGVATALAAYLDRAGLAPVLEEVAPGRPNLLCALDGAAPGPHLLLCGHTDTVPLNAADPGVGFAGAVRDGRLTGRGAVDMKGALAAMAAALAALAEAGGLAAGRVTLAAVVDEEMESLGAEHLVRSGLTADGAVVGEPTGNRLCRGHKGLEWLEISFVGRAAHGGAPAAGVNAIDGAALFVQRVRSELAPRLAARAHPLLGPPTLNFGTVRGGDQPSTVAAACTLTADRRSLPGESYETMRAELEELLAAVRRELPGLGTSVRRLAGGMATLEHVALETPPGERVVACAAAARTRVCGAAGELGAFPAWTDGALLASAAGIPTIVMGPGDLALAHSPRESVAIEELTEAAALYARTALEFCGGR